MKLITLFSQPLLIRYKSSKFSQASLFTIFSWIINIVFPWLIVYRSDGLWQKVEYFWEKPNINFKYDLIMLTQLRNSTVPSGMIVWSSFPQLNGKLDQAMVRVPYIRNYEADKDLDRKYDHLDMKIVVPLEPDEHVSSVKLILLFDYKLEGKLLLKMDSLVTMEALTETSSSRLTIVGDIKFHQKTPLPNQRMILLQKELWRNNEIDHDTSIDRIISDNQAETFTTNLGSNTVYLWQHGRDIDRDEFQIDVKINYTNDFFCRDSSFWYMMKWAWIQYFAIFILFYHLGERVRAFVFQNQLTSTMIVYEPISHLYSLRKDS